VLDTSRITIPEGKFGYLLENPSEAGVFSDSLGFDKATLGSISNIEQDGHMPCIPGGPCGSFQYLERWSSSQASAAASTPICYFCSTRTPGSSTSSSPYDFLLNPGAPRPPEILLTPGAEKGPQILKTPIFLRGPEILGNPGAPDLPLVNIYPILPKLNEILGNPAHRGCRRLTSTLAARNPSSRGSWASM
jgi:hypothetical protein